MTSSATAPTIEIAFDVVRGPVVARGGDAQEHDQEAREQHQGRVVLGQAGVEAHHAVGAPARAGEDHEAEHEQRIGEDRADDRRLRDDDLAGGEREHDDEELGQVAERRLQHPGDGRPEALADLLGREGDDPRQAGERHGRQHEGEQRRRVGVVGRAGRDRGGADRREEHPERAHQVGNLSGLGRTFGRLDTNTCSR